MTNYTPTEDEKRVIAWLRKGRIPPPTIHSWWERAYMAWWGLKNPGVVFRAAHLSLSDAIQRGDHRHD